MAFKIGLVGKPSVGKSTFFNAATMDDVDEAEYPFTTVDPSVGEAYVRIECAAPDFGESCDPSTGFCSNGTRFVPIKLVDVAGLIPGAHEGKGLGNQFLSDLNEADVLVHIVDFSGETGIEGEPADDHDPREDIEFLEEELDRWYLEILEKGIERYWNKERQPGVKIEEELADQMSAFGTDKNEIKKLVLSNDLELDPDGWNEEEKLQLARSIRKRTKPMIIAANKMDREKARRNYREITSEEEFSDLDIIPVSAHAEKALKKAEENSSVKYVPGSEGFEVVEDISDSQQEGLERIENFMKEFGGTGVQTTLETALFDELEVIGVFPVAEGLTDQHGNVLPDVELVPRKCTAEDLAYEIHQDIGEGFINAFDVRDERQIGAEHELSHRDVIRINSSK